VAGIIEAYRDRLLVSDRTPIVVAEETVAIDVLISGEVDRGLLGAEART
jgi:hypothetical protein